MRKIVFGLIIIFILSIALNSFAQEDIALKKVTAIDVKGNETISMATIVAKIKIRVGQLYSQNIISED